MKSFFIKRLVIVASIIGFPIALWLLSFVPTVVFKNSIPSYHYSGKFGLHINSSLIEKIDVGFKNDAPFIWIGTRDRAFSRNLLARIDIINPVEKKRVASIDDEELGSPGFSAKDFERQGEHFAIAFENVFQIRAADGDLLENSETLSKKFPELAAGIGKVQKQFGSESNACIFTTKDGFQYRYFPQKQVLLTEQALLEKEKKVYSGEPIDTTDKDYELRYMWGLSKANEGIRQQLYLTEKYHLSLAPTFNAATMERLMQDLEYNRRKGGGNARLGAEKLVTLVPDVFLDGKILASNSNYCLVLHSQSIEKDADKILSCVNREGKMLWQIIAPKFKAFQEANDNDFSGAIHKNTAAIINSAYKNKAACGLDIQTGKLLWEFTAF